MNLRVLIRFRSQQPYFAHLIADLLTESTLSGCIYTTDEGIVIDAEGEQAQIEAFSSLLQSALPFSIHLGDVQPIEQLPEDAQPLGDRRLPAGLFILPRSAQRVLSAQSEGFLDLFSDDGLNPPITRLYLDHQATSNTPAALHQLADRLIASGSITLQSARGFIKLTLEGHEDPTQLQTVLITHTRFLERTQADDRLYGLLSAIEKPAIRIGAEDLPDRFGGGALMQLPYDLITACFARVLQDRAIDHLYLSPGDEREALLRYEGGVQTGRFLEIAPTESGVLPIEGGALPIWLKGPACADRGESGPLGAVHEEGAICLDRIETLPPRPHTLQARGADAAHAAMLSVLIEHRCVQEDAVGGFLSLECDESALLAWMADQRHFRPIATFAPLPASGQEVIEHIRSLDNTAPTLLENIAHKHPTLLSSLESYRFKGAAPLRLFALLGLLLDFDPRLSERDLFNRLIHTSLGSSCRGGVKIDFKLNADRQIDWAQAARTVLSFRMADVDPNILAVSLFESFCDLLVMQLGDMRITLQTQRIALSGDLLAAPVIRTKLEEHFGRFFKLSMNRDLDTRHGAPAVGALYLQ